MAVYKKTTTLLALLVCVPLFGAEPKQDRSDDEYLSMGGVGADAGSKVGLVTAMYVFNKSAAVAATVGAKASAVGAAIVASPATPVVAGVAAVGAAAYGGHKAYRYFNPNPEDRAKDAEYEAKEAESRRFVKFSQCQSGFKNCLASNSLSRRNSFGIPLVCEKDALDLAIYGGESEVDKITKSFLRFAPAPKDKD